MHPIVRLTALALFIAASLASALAVASTQSDALAETDNADPAAVTAKPKPVRNSAFYKAELPVASQNAAERRGATVRALGQVVVRLTGNPQAPNNNVIRRAAGNIDALTTSSSFRQEDDMVNGVPVYKTVLVVTFDPERVDALVAGAGLKFWTSERPKPILWLVIDDGRGPRLVTAQQTNVVKPLATRGLERGMRYLLPAGSAAEQAAVTSIWNLNSPGLRVLTNRYRNDAQLLGKVYRQGDGWAANWLLTQAGVELARWSFADVDPRRVIASGVDDGANAIAKRDAVYLDTGAAGLHTIDVARVDSQSDYVRLMSYLQQLAIVRKVIVVEAAPGNLRLQLDLGLGMKGFRTMLGVGGTLRPASVPDDSPVAGSGNVPRFELQ